MLNHTITTFDEQLTFENLTLLKSPKICFSLEPNHEKYTTSKKDISLKCLVPMIDDTLEEGAKPKKKIFIGKKHN